MTVGGSTEDVLKVVCIAFVTICMSENKRLLNFMILWKFMSAKFVHDARVSIYLPSDVHAAPNS